MPKITFNRAHNNSYFSNGFLSIGAYLHNNSAILFDSGGDECSAKDAAQALQETGHTVTAIFTSHCHPDHSGGNYFFQKKFPDVKIYAAHAEKEFIEDPQLAPRCFCGGAAAYAGLHTKHIAPQKSSVVTNVIAPYQDQIITIDGAHFKVITLPGHTPGMIGVITPDNVLYSGDALFGQETLKKHAILFYTDIEKTLASFKKLATLAVDACVLYHGGVIHNLAELVQQHETKIIETKDTVFRLIQQQPLSVDMLTQKIMQHHAIPNTLVSFVLTQTAMRAYLTQLEKEQAIQLVVQDGLLQAVAL